MGWTAYYQVVRDRELDDDELVKVAALVRSAQARRWDGEAFGLVVATAQRPSGVIAKGWNKLGMAGSSYDRELLSQTLDKLRALLPDARVNVRDDFGVFGKKALVADDDEDGWSSVLSLVPPPPPKHPSILEDALAALAAGRPLDEDARTDVELVRKLFTALGKNEIDKAPLRALADACDPHTVAHLGLSTYARLSQDARIAVATAIERVEDPATLTEAFLHAWTTPYGLYYYGDMYLPAPFVRAMGAQTTVRERWMTDLDDLETGKDTRDIDRRRAERAARLLGESKHSDSLACLAAIVRRTRDAGKRGDSYQFTLRALAEAASPTYVATTLLALDGRGTLGVEHFAVEGSLVLDTELASPVIRALLVQDIGASVALSAIYHAGPRALSLEDAITSHLTYPSKGRRAAARKALAAIHGKPPPPDTDDGLPFDPELHVAHRNRTLRHDALAAVAKRKDPSLFVALLDALDIDALLCRVVGWHSLPFSWHDWSGVIPKKVAGLGHHERREWAHGAGAKKLGPQRQLAALEPLVGRTQQELLAHYGRLTFELPLDVRASLIARETQVLGE